MAQIVFGVGLAVMAGLIIATQGPVYARMTLGLGGALQTVLLAFSTAVVVLLAVFALSGTALPRLEAIKALPLWVWLGGVMGICVVLMSILAIPRIGVAGYLAAAVAGQLVASLLFDQFGAFGLVQRAVTPGALLGAALVLGGAALIVFR